MVGEKEPLKAKFQPFLEQSVCFNEISAASLSYACYGNTLLKR